MRCIPAEWRNGLQTLSNPRNPNGYTGFCIETESQPKQAARRPEHCCCSRSDCRHCLCRPDCCTQPSEEGLQASPQAAIHACYAAIEQQDADRILADTPDAVIEEYAQKGINRNDLLKLVQDYLPTYLKTLEDSCGGSITITADLQTEEQEDITDNYTDASLPVERAYRYPIVIRIPATGRKPVPAQPFKWMETGTAPTSLPFYPQPIRLLPLQNNPIFKIQSKTGKTDVSFRLFLIERPDRQQYSAAWQQWQFEFLHLDQSGALLCAWDPACVPDSKSYAGQLHSVPAA